MVKSSQYLVMNKNPWSDGDEYVYICCSLGSFPTLLVKGHRNCQMEWGKNRDISVKQSNRSLHTIITPSKSTSFRLQIAI